MPTHPMVTRAKAVIFKPLERMNCHVTTTSPLPRSHVHALRDPNWKEAMLDKYNALITNGTDLCIGLSKPRVLGFSALLVVLHELVFSIRIIASLHSEFAMTDLGSLNYFLESKLGWNGDPVSDSTLYRNHAGALQYLTFTRPDLYYAVEHVCVYMHDPRDLHFTALKRILRYVRGTLDYGLQLHVTLSRSSVEAEYRGVANVVAETAWVRNLLCELHTPLYTAILVYCDNNCLSDESLVIPLEELRVDDKLHFVEEPVEVMDREIKQLKRSRIPIIKVKWNIKRGPEFTWE
ncbi:ribonuclease H-like domain-containing protein [Tanacetum coccineum]